MIFQGSFKLGRVGCWLLALSSGLFFETQEVAGQTNALAGGRVIPELIVLDAICQTIPPASPKLAPGNPAPSTQKMAKLLAEIRAKADPFSAGYMSDQLVGILEDEVSRVTRRSDRVTLLFKLSLQQLNSGRPDLAINTLHGLEDEINKNGGNITPRSRGTFEVAKAMAFLRLGEQENCLASHTVDSCIFPLKPNGYHRLPRGSENAIAIFQKHLEANPRDLSSWWLMNLAYMTLGQYPEKVPSKFLIPPDKFKSEYEMPPFVDIAKNVGLDANDLAGGTIIDDFDNDGDYDVVISAWDLEGPLRFFRNDGAGKFVERTSEAGLVGMVGSLNIQQTDYNNDGLLDIWALRGAWLGKGGDIPNSLLRNNGDGTFTDVTEEAKLLSFCPTQASRWFDFNGDGWLDLFIGNESTNPNDPRYCELYRNNKDGTFTECAEESGILIAEFVKGVACADYDNDGRPDLFLSTRSASGGILLRNEGAGANGKWRFENKTREAKLTYSNLTFATFFFDYNNDGWEDLFVGGYLLRGGVGDVAADYMGIPHTGHKSMLFRNNKDGTFTDVSAEAKLDRVILAMGHNYGDLDNDGWIDFYCATGDPNFQTLIPNRMFRNANGQRFQDVTTATGTGHLQKGHAVSFADLDNDGDQDIYASQGGAYTGDLARNVLFLNPGSTNNWLKIKLTGENANKVAIGAKLKITLKTPAGQKVLHRVVSSGGSFGSNPLRQEIGIGDATEVASVEVKWPGSGTRQVITNLAINRGYEIKEGKDTPVALKLPRVNLEQPGRPGQMQAMSAQ